ncbi:MAG: hypothetical protein A3H52_00695 [Candidatus Zambryskibacteria bacterium RIFCSPLOWO2_02_FULL_39_26]|uniref:Uncharacterized protein n=1 Tax=Candidatus Zambryskibacteria bacterium RIFCSPLOWO2_12_FULL_39_23 TaxID=1802776 RepID=A0A1G2UTB0_9BACT|nr:MAG: hypothetical protein A2W51_00635 [Candidatus Zambryskibacteria bacterium RIFCSPHIGHO2_02_39_10]OHB10238.1 MAG: hypothetical protein A3H52_00695 [Candidatus Zambryskibacteria bacterium RIFCSPLOWO2_02_FULL_39_26]OHB12578.1 MAG: hypothetical protein A3G99_02035 [Candidatus Zambryskibacteria bacterium RIFCSPLOWO2_12_FULL_39_23]
MAKGDKQTFVGQFFEEVGHRILGGNLSRNEDGDICLWRTKTSVEAKSSGAHSSYGFRLSVDQIEHYQKISCFPFDRVWYLLFAYRNRKIKGKSGKYATELSEHINPISINRYLAESALWCVLLDISIISRWKDSRSHSTKSVMGHPGERTVDLKCHEVYHFANGGLSSGLKELGLDPDGFGVLTGRITTVVEPDLLSYYKIKFPIIVVLPRQEISSVKRMFQRRGFRLRKMAN